MATPNAQEFVTTTKGGLDLSTFEDVELFKKVPKIQTITSVKDALERLGNNNEKLLEVLTEGLQAEAVRNARTSEDGWLLYKEDGSESTEVYTGSLANRGDVGPQILNFAKLMFDYEDATKIADTEKRRLAKEESKKKAMEYIKGRPEILASLKKRLAATAATQG